MKYHFKIHREKDGYWAECIEMPGCFTEGDNLSELKKNMEEVLNLYLEEPDNSKVIFPLPEKKINKNNVYAVSVRPNIAFSMLLRMYRIENKITQRQAASKLGMKNIYSYQKLEKAKTSNPTLKTLFKIKEVFTDFNYNLIFC
ncbi:MAG: hypothetical protein APR63_12810 [Desulfuromonas sp. SDB]|nr:MAG: hypothetical protein APR63_12810 [Desulfuromonas sp. SDB]